METANKSQRTRAVSYSAEDTKLGGHLNRSLDRDTAGNAA